ncbi:hypothetical protein LTR36_007244 [Oleoguttula mirabilis]|uniref:Uncharacterized protein n=1 Tax=Oleoguttula mirabilis TaxID=1507867 RepID=A0AAV9J9X5_9PEZI|nr:hypothetical protein LTR36_007244 [Oleoguttula mirabilis]
MATRNGARDEARPGALLLVIHDFHARSADELSLAKGDRIELIERDDDFGDGWFLGRHMVNGGSGLFPEVYTTPAPKGTFTNLNNQRRISEGPPKSAGSTDSTSSTSPTQQRHLSASAIAQTRPISSTSAQASPLAQTALRTSMPSSTPAAARTQTFNADSPVMSETLSVIDEHITDMNSPRSSFVNDNKRDTMGSVYSIQALSRFSYIPGHETDEDEPAFHTEDEVMAWGPARVAEYLEDNGVERLHCDVFKEQEISGEVLLAMDQSSIFIREFELGPVGRRLKTWHKIKALQDEVRRTNAGVAGSHTSDMSAGGAAMMDDVDSVASDTGRNRSSTIGMTLPRGLQPVNRQSMDGRSSSMQPSSSFSAGQAAAYPGIARSSSSAISPLQSMTSMSRPESNHRPSAHTIRSMNHSRRHSSIDSSSSAGTAARAAHRKQPSIDSKWQLGQPQAVQAPLNGNIAAAHSHTMSAESSLTALPYRESSLVTPSSPGELDRGYFSSNELDKRTSTGARKGNVLTKKASSAAVSPLQSRANSFMFNGRQSAQPHSRIVSSDDDHVSPIVPSGNSQHMFSALSAVQNRFGSMRSATSPQLQNKPMNDFISPVSPVVTKLDFGEQPSLNAMTSSPNMFATAGESSKDVTPSPTSGTRSFFGSQKQKSTGLRAISDAVTKNEKTVAEVPINGVSTVKEGVPVTSPTRTGSTTPSTETRSFDLQKSMDGHSRTSTGSGSKLMPPPTSRSRSSRPKTKKATSAYTRGLEKKTPAEQMAGCDYSGWMKKKSGSLMTTWKPRLFILRGRRLSYYYKENDTEEKGLIDISFHRVLPAQNETLTSLHAVVTGAADGPSSPSGNSTPTNAQKDLKENPATPGDGADSGIFIFKLVPPKVGLSKAVNFTKPTVHYFAVNSRQEGRLWMAALMKATIDRDDDGVVTTTYSQKTISLAKARARKERPPALKEEDTEGRAELDGGSDAGSVAGLGIGGLPEKNGSAVAGAEKERDAEKDANGLVTGDGTSSIAPSSTNATGIEDSDVLDEKEAVPVEVPTS